MEGKMEQKFVDKHGGKILFLCWTALCIVGTVFLYVAFADGHTINPGNEFQTQVNEVNLTVSNHGSGLLASDQPFSLSDGTKRISGKETEKPLGWRSEKYFEAKVPDLQGHWKMKYETWITGRVDTEVALDLDPDRKNFFTFATIIIGVTGWAGMIAFFLYSAPKSK